MNQIIEDVSLHDTALLSVIGLKTSYHTDTYSIESYKDKEHHHLYLLDCH
jgi:hypothetical protein